MRPAHVFYFETPKKFSLHGLWFGAQKPAKAIILVHGMYSSAFSLAHVVNELVDGETAVITFNNRGHETVSEVKKVIGKKKKYYRAGTAHEVFTDCVDDIQGAIDVVRKAGVKNIYLAGHSTGCQKSIYWASKTGGKSVKGIILLAPLSDYAVDRNKPHVKAATKLARAMVKVGKKHDLLPKKASPLLLDAQRFLSLNTPDSIEEIFSYSQPEKKPRVYASVTLPILTLFADKDEYSERPAEKMIEWFATNTRSRRFRAGIIPEVGHSFKEGEKRVAELVRQWISA